MPMTGLPVGIHGPKHGGLRTAAAVEPSQLIAECTLLQGTAGQQRPCLRVMICLASLAIVAAILALGVLSIALNHGEIVQSCSPCQAMACISTHWWTCPAVIPALQAHSRCSFSLNNNATTTINCPSVSPSLCRNTLFCKSPHAKQALTTHCSPSQALCRDLIMWLQRKAFKTRLHPATKLAQPLLSFHLLAYRQAVQMFCCAER